MPEDTASSADTRPTIFLIEEVKDAHRPLKRGLRQMGYRVLTLLDLEDTAEWLKVTSVLG